MVNIVATTLERTRNLGVRRTLLLGTNATMIGAMYPEAFTTEGIEIVIPDENDRGFINHSIYADLAAGIITPELRRRCVARNRP